MRDLLHRLVYLFRRKQAERDFEEELRFHVEMQIEQHIQNGMDPVEARRVALRDFGGVEQTKEECRNVRIIGAVETTIQDLRYGLRMLRRAPGFTLIAVLTLALGIGANTAIFSVFHALVLEPLPYEHPEELVMLWQGNPQQGLEQEAPCMFDVHAWDERCRSIELFGFLANDAPGTRNFVFERGDRAERFRGRFTSAEVFELLGAEPLLGRTIAAEEYERGRERVAVLSHGFWQRTFGGDPQVIGQTMSVPTLRQGSCTIVGVMRPEFAFPTDCDVWLSFSGHPFHQPDRLVHELWVFGRLAPGATTADAQAELTLIQQRLAEEHPHAPRVATEVEVVPLPEQVVGRKTRPALLLLLATVGVVLLIACANVANLLLARALSRRKEIAVRSALGAGRLRVMRQLLTESVLLAALGGALGVIIAVVGIRLLPTMNLSSGGGVFEFRINRFAEVDIDATVLVFTAVVAVSTSLLFGLVPTLQAMKMNINDALKEEGAGSSDSSSRQFLRSMLLVGQVSMATVLVIGGVSMVRSLDRVISREIGFRPERVLAVAVDLDVARQRYSGSKQEITQQILRQAESLPGIESAAAIATLPLERSGGQMVLYKEGQPEVSLAGLPTIDRRFITPGYFQVLGIPLIRGRDFSDADRLDEPRVCLINQTAANLFFPGEDPIGSRVIDQHPAFDINRDQFREVIGIVGDVKTFSTDQKVQPEIYCCYLQNRPNAWGGGEVVVPMLFRTTSEPNEMIDALRTTIEGDGRSGRIIGDVRTIKSLLADTASQQRFQALLMSLFAGLALLLAAVGIYGVVSYSVSQRTNEIGIRMALGAQPSDILRLVAGQGFLLCHAGIVIGLLLSIAGGHLATSMLYGVEANDPATLMGVSLTLLIVGGIACYLPARRAMRVDPTEALRYE